MVISLMSELVVVSGSQEVASRSVSRTLSLFWFLFLLLLLSFSCSFILSDSVWFALLNSLPSPPSLALLTNNQYLLHVQPTL